MTIGPGELQSLLKRANNISANEGSEEKVREKEAYH